MSFADVVTKVELTGWSLSLRTGQVAEPALGYLVPMRPDRWWTVYERRLNTDTVKLYVYACAQNFAAEQSLLLYVTKVENHYVLGLAMHVNRIDHAFELAASDGNHMVYETPGFRIVTRRHFGEAS